MSFSVFVSGVPDTLSEDIWNIQQSDSADFAWDIPDCLIQKVSEPTVSPTPTTEPVPFGNKVVDEAEKYIGVPYVWGGTSPTGFDCSGFVQYVYAQFGVDISRTTYTQVNEGRFVERENLQKGDLVFFAKGGDIHHVGIYIGDGMMIHAPYTGEVIKEEPLSNRNDYYTARRIIE